MPGKADGVAGEPALGGVAFAILLFLAVLRRDELRFQGDHVRLTGCHQHRRNRRMRIMRLPVQDADTTPGTMDLGRGKVLRAIQRAQPVASKAAIALQFSRSLQAREDLPVGRLELFRRNRIQQVANLGVAGHRMGAKQAVGIVPPRRTLHVSLMSQKGGRLHEEHRKGAQTRIADHILGIAPFAMLRYAIKPAPQQPEHMIEGEWLADDGSPWV